MESPFEKISFEKFKHESVMSGFIDITNEKLARTVWEVVKEPQCNVTIQMYSPWSFYLAGGKEISLPTGFKLKEETHFDVVNSKDFDYEVKFIKGRHIIVKLKAKKNICVNEGDCFMDLLPRGVM